MLGFTLIQSGHAAAKLFLQGFVSRFGMIDRLHLLMERTALFAKPVPEPVDALQPLAEQRFVLLRFNHGFIEFCLPLRQFLFHLIALSQYFAGFFYFTVEPGDFFFSLLLPVLPGRFFFEPAAFLTLHGFLSLGNVRFKTIQAQSIMAQGALPFSTAGEAILESLPFALQLVHLLIELPGKFCLLSSLLGMRLGDCFQLCFRVLNFSTQGSKLGKFRAPVVFTVFQIGFVLVQLRLPLIQ